MTKSVTPKQFAFFHVQFYNNGYDKKLRFGQVFCNNFNITDNEVFYEQNHLKAMGLIHARYIRDECEFCGATDIKEYESNCTGECEKQP